MTGVQTCALPICFPVTIKGSESGTSFKQALYFKELGFNLHDTMIFHKHGMPTDPRLRYFQRFEYMFVFSGIGTSGYSGFSGKSGFSGFSGIGTSGYSGYSGFSGRGVSGFSGSIGLSGQSGFSGVGTSGYSGFSGLGVSGYSGFSGIGTSGYSGFSGLRGDRYATTSTASQSPANGSKSFTVDTGLAWTAGQTIKVVRTSAPATEYMIGTVTSYDLGTGAMVINVSTSASGGGGPFTDWSLNLDGTPGVAGTSGFSGFLS